MNSLNSQFAHIQKAMPVKTSRLLPFILICYLFHLILLPLFCLAFLLRLVGKDGLLYLNKLAGGIKSCAESGHVIFVGHGYGEAGKALESAALANGYKNLKTAIWVEYPTPYKAMKAEGSLVPVGLGPLNNPVSVMLAIWKWRPKMVIFYQRPARLNIASTLRLFGIPALVANVNISKRRTQIKKRRPFPGLPHVLTGISCVQHEVIKNRLLEIGVPGKTIKVFGPPLLNLHESNEKADITQRWTTDLFLNQMERTVIVAGSTHEADEVPVLRAFKSFQVQKPNALLLIAPRKVERTEELLLSISELSLRPVMLDQLNYPDASVDVVIVNQYGMLADLYSIADTTFVGGTFIERIGGHSFAEPAFWGKPVTIGPHFNTQEATKFVLEENGVLTMCHSSEELTQAWLGGIENKQTVREKAEHLFSDSSKLPTQWIEELLH